MSEIPTVVRADYDSDTRTLTVTSVLLRDLFAAFALAGLVSVNARKAEWFADDTVDAAYSLADEMLEYREKEKVKK